MDQKIEVGHYYLGMAYLGQGDKDKACKAFNVSDLMMEEEGSSALLKFCQKLP